jgi:hypothetical protein
MDTNNHSRAVNRNVKKNKRIGSPPISETKMIEKNIACEETQARSATQP